MKALFNLPLPQYIKDIEYKAIKRNRKIENISPKREIPKIPNSFKAKPEQKGLWDLVKGDVILDDGIKCVVVVTATCSKPNPYVIVRINEDDFYDFEDNIHGDSTFTVIDNVI